MVEPQAIEAAWSLHDALARKLMHSPGRVFTPRRTALRLAELTLSPMLEPPSLVDPACGAGALLLAAIEWAAGERPDWIGYWRTGGLAGWDIEPANVKACNDVLATVGVKQAVERRDALAASGEYDVVLANPPWVSFSGRHSVGLGVDRKAELAARFAAFAGWPAMHTAFAEQCSYLTRQGNGRAGLLLPMQMADLAGYRAARRAVAARLSLEQAVDLGEGVFDGVTEPVGMFIFRAGAGSDRLWLADNETELPARVTRFSPLPAASFGDVGVHTGNAAELLVGTKGPGRPLRVGRDIQPFMLSPASRYLREVELPPGRYARVADASRYRDAVIVLRQTADRPVAARHEPWAYFRNSVLACYGAPGHDPDYLLGILNSDIVGRIHRAMFRDARQRSFPQVKVSHLRSLPVPGREIGPLYERIANAVRAGDFASSSMLAEQAYG